jgi:transcriptional regulator with XRE-family HTH domain
MAPKQKSPVRREKRPRPDPAKDIGQRLRECRDVLDLSNRDLADRLRVEEQTVRNMLSGQGLVTYVKLAKRAQALETSPNEILGHVGAANFDESLLRAALLGAFEGSGLPRSAADELTDAVFDALQDLSQKATPADRRKIIRGQLRLIA